MSTLAVESGVLTVCLACGWVHGYPWRCPVSADKNVWLRPDTDLIGAPIGIYAAKGDYSG